MKKLLLHIALISYAAVVLFKPVLPYVNDFVSHVLFYTKHMATVHYEHGKYHVHFETAKDIREEKTDTPNNSSSSKKDNSVTEHCIFLSNDEKAIDNSSACKLLPFNNVAVINGSIDNDDPPPRC